MPDTSENPYDIIVAPSFDTRIDRWRLVVFFVVVLLVVLGIGVASRINIPGDAGPATRIDPASSVASSPASAPVYLDIRAEQWGSDEEFFPWRPGMTVLDLLRLSGHESESIGRGESAFITQIGGLENDPSAGAGWQYSVNGEPGAVGAGVRRIEVGDHVLWSYGPYE